MSFFDSLRGLVFKDASSENDNLCNAFADRKGVASCFGHGQLSSPKIRSSCNLIHMISINILSERVEIT